VHRTALAPAIASLFAQEFGKHTLYRRALGEAVSVPPVVLVI
jgi:hypothetical protein